MIDAAKLPVLGACTDCGLIQSSIAMVTHKDAYVSTLIARKERSGISLKSGMTRIAKLGGSFVKMAIEG